jgi:hypothetical protein
MQFKSITVITVLLLLVASLSVAGCTVNTPSTTSPTPTPSATPTPTIRKSTPTPTPIQDYSSALDQVYSENYVMTVPFHKTTLNGKECYEGTALKTGTTLVMRVYPMSSYTNAVAFRETLIAKYKSEGWTLYKTTTDDWQGTYGSRMVDISAMTDSAIGIPATAEYLGNQ